MGKSLFYFIGISWVTWYEASAHWILLDFFSSSVKELSLPCHCHAGARSPWSSLLSVMSLDGLWLQCKFCIAEVLLSTRLKPLPCLTAVSMCGHTKHGTVFMSHCPQILNCTCLCYVCPIAVTLSISPITAIRQHEIPALRKIGRGVSAVLQLLQHLYHVGTSTTLVQVPHWYKAIRTTLVQGFSSDIHCPCPMFQINFLTAELNIFAVLPSQKIRRRAEKAGTQDSWRRVSYAAWLSSFSRLPFLAKLFACFLTSMSSALPVPAMLYISLCFPTLYHLLQSGLLCSTHSSFWLLASPSLFIYPFNTVLMIMEFGLQATWINCLFHWLKLFAFMWVAW